MLIFKNKGILVPIYTIVPAIALALLSGSLKREIGGVFSLNYDISLLFGISLIISGLWTYLTSEVYIIKDEVKIKVDFESSFFFIPMKYCGVILLLAGIILLIYGIFQTNKLYQ